MKRRYYSAHGEPFHAPSPTFKRRTGWWAAFVDRVQAWRHRVRRTSEPEPSAPEGEEVAPAGLRRDGRGWVYESKGWRERQ